MRIYQPSYQTQNDQAAADIRHNSLEHVGNHNATHTHADGPKLPDRHEYYADNHSRRRVNRTQGQGLEERPKTLEAEHEPGHARDDADHRSDDGKRARVIA